MQCASCFETASDGACTKRVRLEHLAPQAYRCLIFDSEGIVRRLWTFPEHWDQLADTEILRLLDAPPTPAHGVRAVLHSGSHPTVIASIAAHVHAQELVAELMVVRDTSRALVEERRILLESCRQGREELRAAVEQYVRTLKRGGVPPERTRCVTQVGDRGSASVTQLARAAGQ